MTIGDFCRQYAIAQIGDDKFKIALIGWLAAANSADLFAFATQMMLSQQGTAAAGIHDTEGGEK